MREILHRCFAIGVFTAVMITAGATHSHSDTLKFHTGLDVGMGSADEDGFVLLFLEQGLSWNGLELVLSGPFRFRVIDTSPEDAGALRRQDWDEPSDFARITRLIVFEKVFDDGIVAIHFGELNGVGMGHGSTVDHYFNSVDMDHYQGGARLDVGYNGNGLEFVMDDIVAPSSLAGRIRLAPFAWFLDGTWPRRLEIGANLGADLRAPRRITNTTPTAVVFGGGDVSLKIVETGFLALAPYVDILGMDGDAGVHAGLGATFRFSDKGKAVVHTRGEYRWLGSDYHPALLNPFYEHSRLFYSPDPAGNGTNTFADHLANPAVADAESHAWMVDASFRFEDAFSIGVRFDSEGKNRPHWILFELALEPNDRFDVRAFYAGRDPVGAASLFSTDALMGVGTHVRIWRPIRAFAEYARRFRYARGAMPYANEMSFGVGLFFVY